VLSRCDDLQGEEHAASFGLMICKGREGDALSVDAHVQCEQGDASFGLQIWSANKAMSRSV
jgi:hypothetical protein